MYFVITRTLWKSGKRSAWHLHEEEFDNFTDAEKCRVWYLETWNNVEAKVVQPVAENQTLDTAV
jgi:hypothetical protein